MNNKILKITKKTIAALMLIMVLISTTNYVSAYSLFDGMKESISNSLVGRLEEKRILRGFLQEMTRMRFSGDVDINKITSMVGNLKNQDDKDVLNMILKSNEKATTTTEKNSLVKQVIEAIKNLLKGSGSSSTTLPTPKATTIKSTSSGKFAGSKYEVDLNASIYVNPNNTENKWAVVIHPYMLKGESMAKAVGIYYYEKGYSIIAPDLRGHGKSGGKVAMGCLDSLDVYDWLNYLNDNYKPSKVIVHGISLGAATTNFLSGIDQFMANAPAGQKGTLGQLKSIKELKVIGLVEDCGYTNMKEFVGESILLLMGIGLDKNNIGYFGDATNSLKYCDLPMMTIHGTSDTTVKPSNVDTIRNTVKNPSDRWDVSGAPHAFIIVGMKKAEYREHVHAFIDKIDK